MLVAGDHHDSAVISQDPFQVWRDNVNSWKIEATSRYETHTLNEDIDGATKAMGDRNKYAIAWQEMQDRLDLRKATLVVNHGTTKNNSFTPAEKEHPAGWREQLALLSRDSKYSEFRNLLGDMAIAERLGTLVIEKRTMDMALNQVPELRSLAANNPDLAKVVNSRAGATLIKN